MSKNKKVVDFSWNDAIGKINKLQKPKNHDNSLLRLVLNAIPQQQQAQYDLQRQLSELHVAANRLGLYDAADFIKRNYTNKS